MISCGGSGSGGNSGGDSNSGVFEYQKGDSIVIHKNTVATDLDKYKEHLESEDFTVRYTDIRIKVLGEETCESLGFSFSKKGDSYVDVDTSIFTNENKDFCAEHDWKNHTENSGEFGFIAFTKVKEKK